MSQRPLVMTARERSEALTLILERQKVMSNDLKEIKDFMKDHEIRLQSLEHTRSRQGGVWMATAMAVPVIGFGLGLLAHYLWH